MSNDLLDGVDKTPQFDADKNYLEELVGEGKKFKTPEDLAKGKAYADAMVETLTNQIDSLRDDYTKVRDENVARAKLEELINQLSTKQQQLENREQPDAKEVNEKPQLDMNMMDSLLDDKLLERETRKKEKDNFDLVQSKLKERFGENYKRNLQSQIDELGLMSEDVNALARKSPKAFFRTMGFDQPMQDNNFQTPPRTQRNDNFAPKGEQKRTWSYYQELKKKNPNLFYDRQTNIQMQKDLISLGEEFKDGDYKVFGD